MRTLCKPGKQTTSRCLRASGRSIFLPAFAFALLAGFLCAQPAVARPDSGLPVLSTPRWDSGLAQPRRTPTLNQLIASLSKDPPGSPFQFIPRRRPADWHWPLRSEFSADASPVQHPAHAPVKRHSRLHGSPGHIFWVVPAFNVDYARNFHPLTPKEKFEEWARGAYDPMGLAASGFEAWREHSPGTGFCDYGPGWGGYGECLGSAELDANVSSFFGDFVFTVLLHQDPRYFRLGHGSFGRRLWYAISRVWLTHSDSGRTVFYSSALSGTVLAAFVSNLYYPPQDKGLNLTLTRIGWDLGDTALYNASAEFWPDIKTRLYHFF